MIISAHQPSYLPWLGYLDKIIKSDVFVFLDSVQFEKNSFINRNLVKSREGPIWLSIPALIKGHTSSTLEHTLIDRKQNWRRKHLNAIFLNYKKAPRFEVCYPKLEALYRADFELLSDVCYYQLLFWLREFNVRTKVVRSRELEIVSRKSDLIFDLCRAFGADHYLAGMMGRNYLKTEYFAEAGITVEFQSFQHPVYPQLFGDFVPNLGILDLWMNAPDFESVAKKGNNP